MSSITTQSNNCGRLVRHKINYGVQIQNHWSLWSLALWRDTCCRYRKRFSHTEQAYGSTASCPFICSFQYLRSHVVKDSHLSHLYSFLLCVSVCTVRSAFLINHLPQSLAIHLWVLIVRCTILCWSSCPWKLKSWPHISHGIFFFFWWSYICSWKVDGTLNNLLHSLHIKGGCDHRWCLLRSCTLPFLHPHIWHL